MSLDAYIKFEGPEVEGESVVEKHDKELQISSFSFSAHNSGSRHTATGGGTGKGDASDLMISMDGDKSAPSLYWHCISGTHFDKVTLTVRKVTGGDEDPMDYQIFTMKQCFISSYSEGASNGSETLGVQFSINFAEFDLEHKPQETKGTPGGGITKSYNFAKQN